MEFVLIIVFQLFGIGFHIMQKIMVIDKENPGITRKEIFNIFFKEDWDTLIISAMILFMHLVVHYVIDSYTPQFRAKINYYSLYVFGSAFMLGYLGQRWVYKWLGSAEEKIDSILGNKLK